MTAPIHVRKPQRDPLAWPAALCGTTASIRLDHFADSGRPSTCPACIAAESAALDGKLAEVGEHRASLRADRANGREAVRSATTILNAIDRMLIGAEGAWRERLAALRQGAYDLAEELGDVADQFDHDEQLAAAEYRNLTDIQRRLRDERRGA